MGTASDSSIGPYFEYHSAQIARDFSSQGFRFAAALEIQALRRRGAHVRHLGPDLDTAQLMGEDLMDRRRADRVLAAGYRQGRRLILDQR